MHVFYTPDIANTQELPEEEAGHCLRVLRLGIGDEVMLTDGRGFFYQAVIAAATQKRCMVKIVSKTEQEPFWGGHLHLALAPTKNMDRMEWLAEKATEIGFDELTFLNCRFSERKVIKTDRIEKIVVSAVKQSLKARKPVVNEMTDFRKFMERDFSGQKFIAHCYEGEKPLLRDVLHPDEDAVILVGPEGDFSPEEVTLAMEKGFQPVSLGKSRLRTETAALVAVHLMNLTHCK
ncbi:16S rRNA (uracil(1498)-N(3))-methyltransferase [Bacteroides mediterraneensis]|uniref:16S rRNA (uracil(1498)-N(3))-methyltransferase n=1 Tax=Phocaeicola sp. TaxID=2773926 RepID=UPI00195DCB86|nr:16S rRNA (uracil(1498)-N(3))-methyltransferase [Bacteroides mediterraneensis]MBU3836367.1 16S rRNA (uracil(1498)-N(3))-methyltransferase [Candidatus Phocaeicola merdigallinarum]